MSDGTGGKPFEGQVALVTGSSRGIGAATALALAEAGAHVLLTGRDTKALEAIEDQIFEAGGSATIAPVDLVESDGIARLATAVSQRWGKLDILVVNAAVLPELTSVADIDQRAFNKALTTNVLATQALIANFDPLLRLSSDARVIGMTSTSRPRRAPSGAPMPRPRPLSRSCWTAMRTKPAISRSCVSPWSIPAPPAPPCVPAPTPARHRLR